MKFQFFKNLLLFTLIIVGQCFPVVSAAENSFKLKPGPVTRNSKTGRYLYEFKNGSIEEWAALTKLMTAGGNCEKMGMSFSCKKMYSSPYKAAASASAAAPARSVASSSTTSAKAAADRAKRLEVAKKVQAVVNKPKANADLEELEKAAADRSSGAAEEPDVQELLDAAAERQLSSGIDSTGCVAKFANQAEACSRSFASATSSCDKDSGQNKGMFGQFSSSASAITQQLANLSANSVALACSNIGKLSTAASATLGTFKDKCQGAQQTCIDSCGTYKASIRECINKAAGEGVRDSDIEDQIASSLGDLNDAVTSCQSYDRQIAQADQSLQQTMNSMNNAANCEGSASGDDFCKLNPTNPACTGNNLVASCANEEFAKNNITCQCLKNPLGEGCGGAGGGVTVGGGPSGGLLPTGGSTDPDISDLLGEDGNAITPTASKGGSGEELSGQKGGGAGGLEGSSSAAGGSDGRGSGAAGKSGLANILSGFWGGGSSGTSGAGGAAAGGRGSAGTGSGSTTGGLGNPDLRKFMPGGLNDPRRGPASSSGINARHTDLFKIIKNAYIKQTKSLKD